MSGRRDRGSASIELVGMVPIALAGAVLAVMMGAAFWAVTEANDAVRQGVRAQSLGQDGCAVAEAVLADSLSTSCEATGGMLGSGPSVVVSVEVPVPDVVDHLVPELQVTRRAELP